MSRVGPLRVNSKNTLYTFKLSFISYSLSLFLSVSLSFCLSHIFSVFIIRQDWSFCDQNLLKKLEILIFIFVNFIFSKFFHCSYPLNRGFPTILNLLNSQVIMVRNIGALNKKSYYSTESERTPGGINVFLREN